MESLTKAEWVSSIVDWLAKEYPRLDSTEKMNKALAMLDVVEDDLEYAATLTLRQIHDRS